MLEQSIAEYGMNEDAVFRPVLDQPRKYEHDVRAREGELEHRSEVRPDRLVMQSADAYIVEFATGSSVDLRQLGISAGTHPRRVGTRRLEVCVITLELWHGMDRRTSIRVKF
jgi:hypothetical protein